MQIARSALEGSKDNYSLRRKKRNDIDGGMVQAQKDKGDGASIMRKEHDMVSPIHIRSPRRCKIVVVA